METSLVGGLVIRSGLPVVAAVVRAANPLGKTPDIRKNLRQFGSHPGNPGSKLSMRIARPGVRHQIVNLVREIAAADG